MTQTSKQSTLKTIFLPKFPKLIVRRSTNTSGYDRTAMHILEESGAMWERMSWLVRSLEFSYGIRYIKE